MSALDPLLGRILSNDVEIELSAGLNFKQGLQATINPVTGLTEVSFGSVADHGGLQPADGLHGSVSWLYASAAARRASVHTSADLWHDAAQTDTSPPTIWKIVAVTSGVATWTRIDTGAEVTFNGLWSSLYPGSSKLQVVQGNLAIVEGTTLLHTAGSGPVITLSGTRSATAPTSIFVTTTLGGTLGTWTGLVTYRDGTTQAFTSAATVALTGLGAGLTLNIAAGTAVISTDVWKATAATWTDQSGASKSFTQATAAAQPIIAPGPSGYCELLFDGSNDCMNSAALAGITTPGSTPLFQVILFRSVTWVAGRAVIGDAAGFNTAQIAQAGTTPNLEATNDATHFADTNALPVATYGFVESYFSNTTGDYLRAGSGSAVTGTALGNTAINGREIGGQAGVAFSNIGVLGVIQIAGLPSTGDRADARTALAAAISGLAA